MFHRILVPVDLTEKNTAAVGLARDLSAPAGHVTVLHVIETLDAPFDELEDFYRRLEEHARDRLTALSQPLRDAGIAFEERVRYGKRAPEIVRHAAENEVDLIIISSHRADVTDSQHAWMTISHQIALLAQTSVLLVK